jgi:hypothetical protein
MNFEAEYMIDRLIWRRIVPGVIVIALVVVAFVYLLHSN